MKLVVSGVAGAVDVRRGPVMTGMNWFAIIFSAVVATGAVLGILPKSRLRVVVLAGIAAGAFGGTAVASVTPIAAGEVGVVYRFGEITGQRGEGSAGTPSRFAA
jgi:hypothetical protein